jgi:hypothetical protein
LSLAYSLPGTHSVCVYADNIAGPGDDTLLGCRTLTVPGTPEGA